MPRMAPGGQTSLESWSKVPTAVPFVQTNLTEHNPVQLPSGFRRTCLPDGRLAKADGARVVAPRPRRPVPARKGPRSWCRSRGMVAPMPPGLPATSPAPRLGAIRRQVRAWGRSTGGRGGWAPSCRPRPPAWPPPDAPGAHCARQRIEQVFDVGKNYAPLLPLRVHSEEAQGGICEPTSAASELYRANGAKCPVEVPFACGKN